MELAIDKTTGKLIAAKCSRPQYKRRPKGEMNATEAAYSAYLDTLVKCGEIDERSKFEPTTLHAGKRKYTPDFETVKYHHEDPPSCTVTYFDVKGTRLTKVNRIPRPHIEPQDRLRLEIFAKAFPNYRFVLTWQHREQWYEQEVLG